jgi:hypothetical protein
VGTAEGDTVPKQQNTASKKARALQRTLGGKHTAHLRSAQVCGKQLDPWGVLPETCIREPHTHGPCTDKHGFDQAAWDKQMETEQAAAKVAWDALTPEEQQESLERAQELEYDDGGEQPSDWIDYQEDYR